MMDEVERQTLLPDDFQTVQEFCDLLEYSKQLFNALRDLPQHGQRQWQSHFAKAFETYTKLWKFQQENRAALERSYDLKRWQIGEIASKIGQIYYHYYLRTSETNYLNEAYQFYSAIRARNYYKNVHKEDSADLMLKKHRYYARFILVCLLLNYKDEVNALIKDLSRQVDDYKMRHEDDTENEWEVVMREIRNFPDADPVEILNADTYRRCTISLRLMPSSLPPSEKELKTILSLGDAIIVGNSPSQVKFSELTIDMFRMIQVLERAPGHWSGSNKNRRTTLKKHPSSETSDLSVKRNNPHKYLLYRPTIFQMLTFLSTAVKELVQNNALLLYLSAHGCFSKTLKKSETALQSGFRKGGVITRIDESNAKEKETKNASSFQEIHCFHPADLYPFLRKPLFVIVDSDNANSFTQLSDLFDQPLVCLMAPAEIPNTAKDHFSQGRLMTSFLYAPLMSFMLVCGIDQASDHLYQICSRATEKALGEIQKIYIRSRAVDHNFLLFFGDEFLRLILLRFAFFYCTLRLHRAYKDPRFYPTSLPRLPFDELTSNTVLNRAIIEIADTLGVRGLFFDAKT